MMVAAWVAILALLAIPISNLVEESFNPNRSLEVRIAPDGAREVVLERNRQGHYVASGAINGRPVTFMLDTGATVVSVPASLAADLGLEPGPPVTLNTANGLVRARATRLGLVELGPVALEDIAAVINPGHASDEVLLGMSFLKQLELVQRGGELTVRQPAEP
jgi:aspartyl protease family protein